MMEQPDGKETSERRLLKSIYQLAKEGPKIDVNKNQLKVMENKYLRGDTPEIWLRRVARNIALSEILYLNDVPLDEVFAGCDYKISRDGVDNKSRMFFLHKEFSNYSQRVANFSKFIANLNRVAMTNNEAAEKVSETEEKFYNMLSNFQFLPNSPTLMNAGRDLQQLSGCYVLPVGDSLEEIYNTVTNMALVHKSGGGTGFSFSKIRPEMDVVKTTRGVASGPLSFMKVFDTSTEVIKQGGTRRGANMGILHYSHPDIKKFISCKSSDDNTFSNFNISVAIDDRFMRAVENNEDFELINPRNGEVLGRENAKDLFNLMAKNAWKSGDPGFIVIDRINRTNSNPTPHLGMIKATNPCGEQPLLPNESCNLGSINLSKFVGSGDMNWDALRDCVHLSVNFLDNVIEVNNYPLPKIEEMVKGNRRIGLGVMGWAETLVNLGIAYDSEEAVRKAREVMKFINETAIEASIELARTRGVFPNFKGSIYDSESEHFRGKDFKVRHAARTTIAPTGTIAITAGLQGSGIEPFFAIAYRRYQAEAVDELKQGKEPDEKFVYYECISVFKELAKKHDWFGLEEKELMKKIADNHGSVRGIAEIPKEVQRIFPASHDVDWRMHVDHQSAFQEHTENAVSKTINLPNKATVDDIKEAYWYAYKKGAKGVTVYRDGCKSVQVLSTGNEKKKSSNETEEIKIRANPRDGISSDYYEIPTGYGNLHINIAYDEEQGPHRIFTTIPPLGTELSSLVTTLGIFMSKAFQHGYKPQRSLKHLNSAKGDRPLGFGPNRVDSIPHAIGIALRKHLEKTGKLESARIDTKGQTILPSSGQIESSSSDGEIKATHCPKCYSPNIAYLSGCSGPTCFDCGYSHCS